MNHRRPARAALCLFASTAVLVLGALSCAGSAAGQPWPGTVGRAYVDVTVPHDPLAQVAARTGLSDYVLAFVLAREGECRGSWGGVTDLADPALLADLAALRAGGGSVAVASGGASGAYLENACGDAASLSRAYGEILDITGSNHLDVDIEQPVPVNRVLDALGAVQRERGTEITLTLQVDGPEQGFTAQARGLLQAAADRDLAVTANAMVMNVTFQGGWATAITTTGERVVAQVQEIWPDLDQIAVRQRVGLTFMIGENDTGVVTTVADASTVTEYAAAGGAGAVAFWSLSRDNGDCPSGGVRPTCSGIAQQPYEFTTTVVSAL